MRYASGQTDTLMAILRTPTRKSNDNDVAPVVMVTPTPLGLLSCVAGVCVRNEAKPLGDVVEHSVDEVVQWTRTAVATELQRRRHVASVVQQPEVVTRRATPTAADGRRKFDDDSGAEHRPSAVVKSQGGQQRRQRLVVSDVDHQPRRRARGPPRTSRDTAGPPRSAVVGDGDVRQTDDDVDEERIDEQQRGAARLGVGDVTAAMLVDDAPHPVKMRRRDTAATGSIARQRRVVDTEMRQEHLTPL